jgi:predicted nucleotidyltransferase
MIQNTPKSDGASGAPNVAFPLERIAELCRAYRVHELAVFGSALREDFRPDSDVDFLVEFEPDAPIGLLDYCALQNRLAELVHRRVDLVSTPGLKLPIRDGVLAGSRVIYAQ